MEARELIESWCMARISPADAGLLAELAEILAQQEELIQDPVRFIECDRAFHRAIVRRAGNPVLAEFYESLRERQVRMGLRAVANDETRSRTVLAEHTAIVASLRAGEAAGAVAALTTHLSSTMAALHLPGLS